jgi:O-antigen/teichoic acid export membrane protein
MLIKRTFQFLPAQIIAPMSQFLSIVIWTYFCSPTTIGILTLLAVFQELANKVIFTWWNHYTLRYYDDSKENDNWKQSDKFVLGLTIIQIFITILVLKVWFTDQFDVYFYISASLYMGLRSLTQFFATLSSIRGKVIQFNIYSISGPALGLLIGILFLMRFGDNPIYPIFGYILGESISVVIYYYLNDFKKNNIPLSIVKSAFMYGGPILFAGIFDWISANGTRLIIESQIDLAAVGQFAVGFGLGQRAAGLVSMLVTPAALPLAMNKMRDEGRKAAMVQLSDNFALLVIVMLPAMAGLFMINKDFIPLIIAPEFQESTLTIFPISLLSGGLFAVLYNYCNHYFLVTANTKPLIYINIVLASSICFFSLLFLQYFGFFGGVLAMVLSVGIVVAILCFFLISYRDLEFPLRTILLVTISVSLMCLGLHFIDMPLINGFALIGIKISIGVVIYSAFLYPFFKKGLLINTN